MTRLLRIKMAVAGVLGHRCARHGGAFMKWPWEVEAREPSQVYSTQLGRVLVTTHKEDTLQVGHPKGRHWSIRKVNTLTRWTRYLREALAGKVQAECGPCNRKHGGSIRYKRVDRTRQGRPRRKHSRESNIYCDICSPLRCSKAP